MIKKAASDKTLDRQAFALTYRAEDQLPKVLMSGKNEIADLIIEIAALSEVPVQENEKLCEMLKGTTAQQSLSSQAIKVLAEVIGALYQADRMMAAKEA